MLNTFILEGRLKEISEIKETDRGTKFMKLLVSSERTYRNNEGNYDADLIEVELWRGIAEVCSETCMINDIISIQGRIQSSTLKTNEGKEFIVYKFIGEKVSFITKKGDF